MDLRGRTVLQGFFILATVFIVGNKGLACEAPSPPQCFLNPSHPKLYVCEWRVPASMTNASFTLHFSNATAEGKKPWATTITETKIKDSIRAVRGAFIRRRFVVVEQVISSRPVYIWLTAHMGNSSCDSANTSVTLSHTVKYTEPVNILKSWSTNNLSLSWNAMENTRAAVQVEFGRLLDTTAQWDTVEHLSIIDQSKVDVYQVTLPNLQRDSAYRVRVRHKSTAVLNALWSDWSEVQMVPIVIKKPPDVTWQEIDKGTQRVLSLTWKAPSLAASVSGVTYSVNDSQSCNFRKKGQCNTNTTACTMYVSNSPVNIFIIAENQVGQSPPAVLNVPVKLTKDIKPCDQLNLTQLCVRRKSCIELYTFQHGDPVRLKTLPARKRCDKMELLAEMEDFVRYYYFEHKCKKRTPQTIKMCIFYKNEGAPRVKPQGLEYNSTLSKLWWNAISVEDQRGFLTHYSVCITKTSPHDRHPNAECHNVSASHTEHPLEKLSPGFIYNISVSGVTAAGAGPKSIIIKSAEERKSWKNAWTGLVVVFVFLFILILCTIIFKRFKKRILPPVPVPVLPTKPYCPEEMLEMKEEVHKLTLHHQPPVPAQTPEDQTVTTTTPSAEEVMDDDDEDSEGDWERQRILGGSDTSEGPCDEPITETGYKDQGLKLCGDVEVSDGLGQGDGDGEVTLLVYRNGLVFDMKAD